MNPEYSYRRDLQGSRGKHPVFGTFFFVPAAKKPDDRQFKVGDKIRANLHHGKIEDAIVLRLDSGC